MTETCDILLLKSFHTIKAFVEKVLGRPQNFMDDFISLSPSCDSISLSNALNALLKDIKVIASSCKEKLLKDELASGTAEANLALTEQQRSMVQITANNDEVKRRMQAFLQRKQLEVDSFNRREFCNMPEATNESTCARTDAAYIQRRGKKSIVEVTEVSNVHRDSVRLPTFKKRRRSDYVWPATHPSMALEIEFVPPEVNERLGKMEEHLGQKLLSNRVKQDIYQRIRDLEKRILYLEGLSSEYFRFDRRVKISPRFSESAAQFKNADVDIIDDRIYQLRKQLLGKCGSIPMQDANAKDS